MKILCADLRGKRLKCIPRITTSGTPDSMLAGGLQRSFAAKNAAQDDSASSSSSVWLSAWRLCPHLAQRKDM